MLLQDKYYLKQGTVYSFLILRYHLFCGLLITCGSFSFLYVLPNSYVRTKVLNMYSILMYKCDIVNELPVHNFIFQHIRRHCQTFIKSWNQLLYPRFIEVCRLPFEPRHDFFLHLIIIVELFPSEMFL